MSKTIRRIFKVSKSHVVTLPPEWVQKLESNEVAVFFDNFLLVIPKNQMGKVDKAIEKAILEVVKTEAEINA